VQRGVTFNYRVLPKPDFKKFVSSRLRREPTIDLPEVVTLRFPYVDENNYCHFIYHLVGGRLRLAEECGVPEDVPIVVGERLHSQPFFHDFVRLAGLAERRFVVQDHRYVRSERIFLPQCFEHSRDNLDYLHRCLSVPDSDPQSERRLFSSRRASTGRNITNMADVEDLCRRFGFEIVEQEGMSLDETMELFSQARFVMGIFGAGLGSIAFRKNAPLSLLEIFPPAYTWPRIFYRFFASALGHRHYYYGVAFGNPDMGITGNVTPAAVPMLKPNRDRSSFAVDTDKLEKVLRAMLDEAD
jgi:capsular polysaccharide biosynthesis protein